MKRGSAVFVIGTAGHVDHGKSTLVKAISGIDPDRLREEKEREMTIDLGFAWLRLPSGREVSIVDVPGHEDFIKNMLAGIGGIDLAVLVVAADESVMPQTREHLAILDLLQIPRGVVALTRIDLVADPEWIELVQEEVREELEGTVLADAPIIPVSALTGQGLPDLLATLDRLLDEAEPRPDLGRPRLPIDRVFTISGFGTVVTGTLIDGRLRVGDAVEIVPGGLQVRIRGLQTHKTKEQEAEPGSRVAANLSGVDVADLWRGQVVTKPGWLEPTTLLDARLRVLANAPWPLKHNALLEFYTGAARVMAYVRLLDHEQLEPGQEGWVQYRLQEPVAVVRGDRYIVRLPSPSVTIGGGQVVQTNPRRRYKRFQPQVIERLQALSVGDPEDILLHILHRERALPARELLRRSNLPEDEALSALKRLIRDGRIVLLGAPQPPQDWVPREEGLVSKESWDELLAQIETLIEQYHARYPLRPGMPREELKSRVQLDGALFNQFIEHAVQVGRLEATPVAVRLPGHQVRLSPEQQKAVERILRAFQTNRYTPPSVAQVEEELGADLLQYLLDEGRLIKASDTVLFDAETYEEMKRKLIDYLRVHERITVAEVRDLFDTSRKYALAFLEDMDRHRITKRLGDIRVLR
ncbi:MAG: selenocysteine-specific translation elongation factor [Chloroflexi bacterium]|nr:selenocysteine-specific translation elongation factor [Chloroflexota bacterium]